MKYIDALKKYNEGKTKWCMPKRGSADYIKIKKRNLIIKKINILISGRGGSRTEQEFSP